MTQVAVVGTGPVGLATADLLADAGHQVLLIAPVADASGDASGAPIRRTHPAALAFWTPFSSGLTGAEEIRLSQRTLEFYRGLDPQDEASGVRWRAVEHYWPEGTCRLPEWIRLPRLDYQPLPYGNRYISYPEAPFRLRCEYSYRAPVIDVDRFCCWRLDSLAARDGIELLEDWPLPLVAAADDPSSVENHARWLELFDHHGVQAVVLCTGAGAVYDRHCDDQLLPPGRVAFKKGVVARVDAPADASVDAAERAVLFHGGLFDVEALCYVPHDSGYVVGGTVYPAAAQNRPADWQVEDREKAGIRQRAATFLPDDCREKLAACGFWNNDPMPGVAWRAGVRPMLANSGPIVAPARRLSRQWGEALGRPLPTIVHFGHGGSGFTTCCDTAALAVDEVGRSVRRALIRR